MRTTVALSIALVSALAGTDANAQFIFGTPVNLGPAVNTTGSDGSPSVSSDGMTLHFDSLRPGGLGDWDIWVSKAQTPHSGWGPAELLPAPVNSPYADTGPCISADGLALYFASDRPGGYGNFDIWVTTRKTTQGPWEEPFNLGMPVNGPTYDNHPAISPDGLTLYLDSAREFWPGIYDLYVAERASATDAWSTPVNMGQAVNTSCNELSPSVSGDGLILCFDYRGVFGDRDILMITRASARDTWTELLYYGSPLNTWYHDTDPSMSLDGSMLYFGSTRPGGTGGQDLWQISIAPVRVIPDFDLDGLVNLKDYSELAAHWLDNTPAFDIAPPPNGDGTVNHRDLAGLMAYWLIDFRLLAHWKLDEAEGTTAKDSIGNFDGMVQNGAKWLVAGGKVNGAVNLDGIDDFVSTDLVLDPQAGPFSVYAWIKGGAPGEVVISQAVSNDTGQNWLSAGASNGKFVSELQTAGRDGYPIVSETVITDGLWHEIGFAWDGAYRCLYLDGLEVARDETALAELGTAEGGLFFGTASDLDEGTFFSGLIDDIRIYNKAVTP